MIDYRAYQSARWHSSPFQSNVSFVTPTHTRIVASATLRLLILAVEEIASRSASESETEAQCPALSQMRNYITDSERALLLYLFRSAEAVVVYVDSFMNIAKEATPTWQFPIEFLELKR